MNIEPKPNALKPAPGFEAIKMENSRANDRMSVSLRSIQPARRQMRQKSVPESHEKDDMPQQRRIERKSSRGGSSFRKKVQRSVSGDCDISTLRCYAASKSMRSINHGRSMKSTADGNKSLDFNDPGITRPRRQLKRAKSWDPSAPLKGISRTISMRRGSKRGSAVVGKKEDGHESTIPKAIATPSVEQQSGESDSHDTDEMSPPESEVETIHGSAHPRNSVKAEEKVEEDKTYFWLSSTALEIYFVLVLAAVTRSIYVLQLIPLLFLGQIALVALKWMKFIKDTKRVKKKKFKNPMQQMMFFGTKACNELNKALKGDMKRQFAVGMALKAGSNLPLKEQAMSMVREKTSEMNKNALKSDFQFM